MIVDDEPNVLERLAAYIQEADEDFHVVAKALGAEDALFYLGMAKPDLVITDIRMPVTDGLAMLEEMRRSGWQGLAAILTGHDDFAYAQHAIRLDAFEYLLKPFFPEDVAALLQRTKTLLEQDRANTARLRAEIRAELERGGSAAEDDGRHPAYIGQAKAYIIEHFADPLTLTQVAKAVSINPVYLSSRFARYCGCNFLEYVTRYRMDRAKELLSRTNLQIQEVAARVGYADVAYFSRVFRREIGMPPSKFRS